MEAPLDAKGQRRPAEITLPTRGPLSPTLHSGDDTSSDDEEVLFESEEEKMIRQNHLARPDVQARIERINDLKAKIVRGVSRSCYILDLEYQVIVYNNMVRALHGWTEMVDIADAPLDFEAKLSMGHLKPNMDGVPKERRLKMKLITTLKALIYDCRSLRMDPTTMPELKMIVADYNREVAKNNPRARYEDIRDVCLESFDTRLSLARLRHRLGLDEKTWVPLPPPRRSLRTRSPVVPKPQAHA